MTRRVAPAGLIAKGHQEINFDHTSVAVGLNSTTNAAEVLYLSVETANVRYRADGTDPQPSTGVLLTTGHYTFDAIGEPQNWAFIDADSTADVQLTAFVNAGWNSR